MVCFFGVFETFRLYKPKIALLGESLCIVSSKPQTTRHRILGILTNENPQSTITGRGSYQLIFSDTPGMLAPVYKLQETMQETACNVFDNITSMLLMSIPF